MTREKKKITIEVDPLQGAVTIGLLKGILPSIIRQLEIQGGDKLHFTKVDDMQEVLEEIYEKCIRETDIRKKLLEMGIELPN